MDFRSKVALRTHHSFLSQRNFSRLSYGSNPFKVSSSATIRMVHLHQQSSSRKLSRSFLVRNVNPTLQFNTSLTSRFRKFSSQSAYLTPDEPEESSSEQREESEESSSEQPIFETYPVTTIKVSITSPSESQVTTAEVVPDPFVLTEGGYTLAIDLQDLEMDEFARDNSDEDPDNLDIFDYGGNFRRKVQTEEHRVLVNTLKNIASQDKKSKGSTRIDAVEFNEAPHDMHLLALDGLSPKHLKVNSEYDEKANLSQIDRLLNLWTDLKSLHIVNEKQGWTDFDTTMKPHYPRFIMQLEALTLERCAGFLFDDNILPTNLTRLKLVDGTVMNSFNNAMERIPGLPERLEMLYISSVRKNAITQREFHHFRELLAKCSGLRDLVLILGGQLSKTRRRAYSDRELANFIPNSVENLAFISYQRSMADVLDEWIMRAQNPEWLPNLKTICIRANPLMVFPEGGVPYKVEDEGVRAAVESKIDKIYEILSNRSPPVLMI